MKVQFKNWSCKLVKQTYQNGRTALQLVEDETHEPIAMATVNMPDYRNQMPGINKEILFIKNWSENKGLLPALIDAGIILNTTLMVPVSDFVSAHVVTLTDEAEEYLNADHS